MADRLNGLIISEVLADNAGGGAIDTDGDGRSNKADEFIEIQNASGAAISLSGYQLWSENQGLLYTFGATAAVGSGQTATVVGNYGGTPPAGFYSAGAAENVNWLPDGEGQKFDSIFLVDTATGDYVVLSYGQPPRTPTPPSGFTGTNRIGAGETINSNAPNGTAFARNANGDLVESAPSPGTPGVPCFVKGTLIDTPHGAIPVEALRPGMRVMTRDAGPQPILAIRAVPLSTRRLRADPDLLPVFLPPGLWGATRLTGLSPTHRVMLRGAQAQLFFGSAEVLMAAHHLIGHGALRPRRALHPVTYFHLLLADHVILRVQGIWTESLFLGDVAAPARQDRSGWQVEAGVDLARLHHTETARPILRGYEAGVMLRVPAGAAPAHTA